MPAIKVAVTHNDGLTTFLRRFSTRKEAHYLTTCLQERGFQARMHDRTYGATERIDPKQRYEIVVKPEDFGSAFSAMVTEIAKREENLRTTGAAL